MKQLTSTTLFCIGFTGQILMTGLSFAATEQLLNRYESAGAGPFSASKGQSEWIRAYTSSDDEKKRRCSSCHGTDLTQPGKHAITGKHIKPMATSVNAERLTDSKKVEKWFRRNCRWTLGRECTPQEKGDFLLFINQQ